MLSPKHRLTSGRDFSVTVRRGARVGSDLMVVFVAPRCANDDVSRVGVAVGRGVGNAVTRNLVKRRLRAVLATVLPPQGFDVVVRANPAVASVSFSQLASSLQSQLERALTRAEARRAP